MSCSESTRATLAFNLNRGLNCFARSAAARLEARETVPRRSKSLFGAFNGTKVHDAAVPAIAELARDLPRMLPRPLLSLPRGHLAVRPSRHAAHHATAAVSPCGLLAEQRPCGQLPVWPSCSHRPAPSGCLAVRRATGRAQAVQPPRGRLAAWPCRHAAVQSGENPSRRVAQPPRGHRARNQAFTLAVGASPCVAARPPRRADASTRGSLAASPHGRFAARMSRLGISPSCRAAAARQSRL